MMHCIGLMSGTSMDGVDAALIKTDGKSALVSLAHCALPYPSDFQVDLKTVEFAVRQCQGNITLARDTFDTLSAQYYQITCAQKPIKNRAFDAIIQQLTVYHAQAVQQCIETANVPNHQIDLIGFHGQTVYHAPVERKSLQLGDANLLATLTGLPVIYDFRTADINAGGQGAPLAPLYHLALALRDNHSLPMAFINCGGIANVSFIGDNDPNTLRGFDSGPGNNLIDRVVRQRTQGQAQMDRDGAFAACGAVHENLFPLLYETTIQQHSTNYYQASAPKSLDSGQLRLPEVIDTLSLEDACATLAAFTAQTIVDAIAQCNVAPRTIILAGGGWQNPAILSQFQQRYTQHFGALNNIMTAAQAGYESQAIEAELIAYLAARSQKQLPLTYPGITGVSQPMPGGVILSME